MFLLLTLMTEPLCTDTLFLMYLTSEHKNTVQQYTKTQVNSWSNVIILISPGDQRVPALHQHLVLRDLPQADPLHRSDNPHRPSCQGACRGLKIL